MVEERGGPVGEVGLKPGEPVTDFKQHMAGIVFVKDQHGGACCWEPQAGHLKLVAVTVAIW